MQIQTSVMSIGVTRAADGLARRAFSADDVQRMLESGVVGEDENFELIEGDFVVMPPKYAGHEIIKTVLGMAFIRSAPENVIAAIATTLQLAEDVLVEPDIAILPHTIFKGSSTYFTRPHSEEIRLLIEIAQSSLTYDRDVKGRLYARHGIKEFWVIDA